MSINIIIKVLASILEIYLFFDFMKSFFELKKIFSPKWIQCTVVLGGAGFMYLVNSFNNTIINMMFVPLTLLAIAFIVFKGAYLLRFAYLILSLIIFFGSEFLFAIITTISNQFLVDNTVINYQYDIMNLLIIKFITFILFSIVKQIPKKSNKLDIKTFFMFLILSIASLGMMVSVFYSSIDFEHMTISKMMLIICSISMIVGNILIFYAFNRYSETVQKSNQQELQIAKQELELKHYENMEFLHNSHSQMLHDINHHLKVIALLADQNKNKQILEVLQELQVEFEKSGMIQFSGNPLLNAILSEYKSHAEKKKIKCDIYVEPGFRINRISDTDMIAMISNLMSNAMEASIICNDGMIKIRMFMQNEGSFSVMKIVNNYENAIIKNGDKILTTKKDKSLHGIGIGSVEAMAEKYGRYLQHSHIHNKFTAILILPA